VYNDSVSIVIGGHDSKTDPRVTLSRMLRRLLSSEKEALMSLLSQSTQANTSLGLVLRQARNLSFPIVAYVLVFFCKHSSLSNYSTDEIECLSVDSNIRGKGVLDPFR
jgi:hypothetical protein